MAGGGDHALPPGTAKPKRFLPKLHYELLVCGLRGHELLGTDVAEVRESDVLVVHPSRRYMPAREQIHVPLRGNATSTSQLPVPELGLRREARARMAVIASPAPAEAIG